MYELSSVKAIFVYYLPWPLSQDALELQHIPSFSSASPTTVNIHMQGKKTSNKDFLRVFVLM